MGWREELLPGSYRNIELEIKNYQISSGKKGSEHDKPQQDGGSREDLGNNMRSISVIAFVAGTDYKDKRDELESALKETGPAILQLPTREPINAIPVGWSTSENTIDDGGFARFSIEFLEVTGELAPTLSNAQQSIVTQLTAANTDNIGESFAESLIIETNADLNSILDYFDIVDEYIDNALGKIMPDELIAKYNELKAVINASKQRLLKLSPVTIASAYAQFIGVIATDVKNATQVIDGQKNLIDDMLNTFPFSNIKNSLKRSQSAITEMVVNSALNAISTTANEWEYQNRPQAKDIINQILDAFNTSSEGLQNIESLFKNNNSDKQYLINSILAQSIDDIISRTVQSVIQRSYTLATERTYTIEKDRTIIDLCHEIYGNIDNIDNLVEWNELNNPLMVFKGQKLVYYI